MNQLFYTVYIVIISLFVTNILQGQIKPIELESIDPINRLVSTLTIDDDKYDDIIEQLTNILENPIDLNNTNEHQLTELFILSPQQIIAILNYCNYNDGFSSIYELQLIPQLNKQIIELIAPFLYVGSEKQNRKIFKLKDLFQYPKHTILTRFDIPLYTKDAYKKDTYYGDKYYFSFRYNLAYTKHLYFGVGAEKDPGEAFLGPYNKKGFDYYTYYLMLKDYHFIDYLLLGKYRLSWGQGLIIGTPKYGSKFTEINKIFNSTNQCYKHASMDEYNYLNGVVCSFKINSLNVSSFFSKRLYDGVIDKNGEIDKHYKTGLHRTDKEVEAKKNIKNYMLGLRLSMIKSKYYIAVNGIYYDFNGKWKINPNKQYTFYNPVGNRFYNYSLDYGYYFNKLIIKGEIAKGKRGVATINNLYFAPSSNHEFFFSYRYYSKDYWGMYAKSSGNQSSVRNENGYFISYVTKALEFLTATLYADYGRYPGYRYRVSKPSKSYDLGAQVESNRWNNHTLQFNYRYQVKERDKTGSKGMFINKLFIHKIKLQYICILRDWIQLKTLIGYNYQHEEINNNGYHITERITLQPLAEKLKIDGQFAFFKTTDYDTRVYVYENAPLYSFSSFSFSGRGCRGSVNINYKMSSLLQFTCKFGCTNYFDRKTIGQGRELINGSHKCDLQCQLRIKI